MQSPGRQQWGAQSSLSRLWWRGIRLAAPPCPPAPLAPAGGVFAYRRSVGLIAGRGASKEHWARQGGGAGVRVICVCGGGVSTGHGAVCDCGTPLAWHGLWRGGVLELQVWCPRPTHDMMSGHV